MKNWSKAAVGRMHARYMASPLLTLETLGAEYGLNRHQVGYLFRRQGLPGKGLGVRVGKKEIVHRQAEARARQVWALRRAGKKMPEIMAETGLTRGTVKRSLALLDAVSVPWRWTEIARLPSERLRLRATIDPTLCRVDGCLEAPRRGRRGLCLACWSWATRHDAKEALCAPSRRGPRAGAAA